MSYPIFKHLNGNQFNTVREIDRLYSLHANGPQKATSGTIHLFRQFTGELPEKFRPAGPYGHQYIECDSIEAAEKLCLELREFIKTEWPDHLEWAGTGWYRWMIHDLRQMTLEFI